MWSLYLVYLVGVASATDIVAFRQPNCVRGGAFGGIIQSCQGIPPNVCCAFPAYSSVSSVYVGTFPLPGGIGNWHYNPPDPAAAHTSCGRVMDSDGDADSVCLSDILMGTYAGGGGTWLPVNTIDPAKTRTGTVIPPIAAPAGFKNIAPFGRSGFKARRSTSLEDREAERREANSAMSIEEWQVSCLGRN